MNVILWILQGLLAAFFAIAGAMKVSQPKERLADARRASPAARAGNAVRAFAR